jgi:arsenite-transporting ATPase
MRRIILYTGKGGVGKSTVSAATALKCSELGYHTLVMSTDSAHSLSDAFEFELADEPTPVLDNLDGLEVNVQSEIKKNWGVVQTYFKTLFSSQGLDNVVAEELSIFPGMEELFSLLRLIRLSEKYDVVIVDCAPTAGTLQLLSFPEVMRWYMEHLFSVERKLAKAIRPVANRLLSVPFPEDNVFDSIEKIYNGIDRLSQILTDPRTTTVRLVVNPEKMVLKESHRAYTYLMLYGLHVDEIILNKIIPHEVQDAYFSEWLSSQSKYIELAEMSFSPLPIRKLKLLRREVSGIGSLKEVARGLYGTGDEDPTHVRITHSPMSLKRGDDKFILEIMLPFASKDELELFSKGDELAVVVGNYKRIITLPTTLVGRRIISSKFREGKLTIEFEGR